MKTIVIPKKQHVASLDVHAQKTFTPLCPEELPIPEGHLIAKELNEQAKKASLRIGSKEAHHQKAIWVATESSPTLTPIAGEEVDVTWPAHSITGTQGFELINGLPKITEYDYYIWEGVELDMHPYGVCYHDQREKLSTGIIEFLKVHHISTVIVGGLATDYCVKVSTLQLLKAGFNVILNLSACRGLSENSTNAAIEEMKKAGAIIAHNARSIINETE